ncbi:MAG: GAP family protein [Actinobacteria bacterium]|nr:GAP family protein [Actinomycetota bacterium]
MLVQAIGDVLPSAVGVLLSPIPIIAVIVVLGTPAARRNGPAFAAGWVVALVVVSTIIVLVAGGADEADSAAAEGVDWFKVALGVLFLFLAFEQWRGRPRAGEEAEVPPLIAKLDGMGAGQIFGLGIALAAVNPKNLALTTAAAATIAQYGLDTGGTATALAVFVVIGSLSVVGPVVAMIVATDRVTGPLASVKTFMIEHNAAIMIVLLLVLGTKMLGQGLGAAASS